MRKPHSGGRRNQRKKPLKPDFACHTETQLEPQLLKSPLDEVSYVVFDIESTGGNPSRNGITEIYAVRYRGGEKLDSFYSMVNPKVPIPPIVRRMTGITNAMVKDAPEIETVMPKFLEFLGSDVLVSHNTIGDLKFLVWFAAKCCGHKLTNYFLCTHLLTERLISESKDKSLKGLAKFFEFDLGEVHRAEADAMLTLKLFQEIRIRLEKSGFQTLEEAIRLQGDMESAIRIGWGLSDEVLHSLPEKPGVFELRDASGKKLFRSSAVRIKQDVWSLKDFASLAKPLMKLVLQSSTLHFEVLDDVLHGMLREEEGKSQRYPAWNWHGRVIAGLSVARCPKEQNYHLTVGPVPDNCVYFFGPVHDRKKVQEKLAQMGKFFDSAFSRKVLTLSGESFEVAKLIFDEQLSDRLEKTRKRSRSIVNILRPKKRKFLRQELEQLKALEEINLLEGMQSHLPINGQVLSPDQTQMLVVEDSQMSEWQTSQVNAPSTEKRGDLEESTVGPEIRAILWLKSQKPGKRSASKCQFETIG